MNSHWDGALWGVLIILSSFVIYFCLVKSVKLVTRVYGHTLVPINNESSKTSYTKLYSKQEEYTNTSWSETETITDDP